MLVNVLATMGVVYVGIMAVMFAAQRSLMYYPETEIFDPAHYGLPEANVITLSTKDGLEIEAWHLPPSNPSLPTLLYFHGNAGHIGDRIPKLAHFTGAGFGLLAVSYRGYGRSQGAPHESGLYEDADTTLNYALDHLKLTPKDLLVYGESLGSGVATHTAKRMADAGTPALGLVLEAGYTSVAQRAQEMYPFIPAYYLARDKYLSIEKIAGVGCPLLVFHGEKDSVIPVHHGRKMLEIAQEPKRGIFFEEVDHTDFDYPTLTKHLLEFAKEHISA